MHLPSSIRRLLAGRKEESEKSDFNPFTGVGTLLMSNMTGFSGLTSEWCVEDLARLMNRLVEIQARAIHATNGGFLWFHSDVSLAYWHPSHTEPSHAAEAFDCGQRILAEVHQANAQEPVAIKLRVAVATGDMTMAIIAGKMQIVGRAYATATRLLGLKLPHESSMLCTEETLRLLPDIVSPSRPVTALQPSTGELVNVYEFGRA